MKYIVTTPLSTQSNLNNSVDGIQDDTSGSEAYCQLNNAFYKFYPASLATADGDLVVIPFGQDPAVAGRWLREGPPGPSDIIPSFPGLLVPSGLPFFKVSDIIVPVTGGANFEAVTNFSVLIPTLQIGDVVYASLVGTISSVAADVAVNTNLIIDGALVVGTRLIFRRTTGNLVAGNYPVRLTMIRPTAV